MFKPYTLIAFLALLPFLATVHAQVPTYPAVWDSAYPMNRCIDFCAFLRPGQICPAEPHNANCLCSVYNIRLPAVLPLRLFLSPCGSRILLVVRRMLEVEERYCGE